LKKHKTVKKSIVASDFESREILKSTLDASDQIIFVKNLKGVYILANTAFSVRFRRPLSKIVGMTDKDIFTEKDVRKLRTIDRSIIGSGRRDTREDTLLVNGKKRIFRATKVPIWSTEGKIIALCGFAEEITEQKRTQLLQDITYRITNATVQHNSLAKLYRIIHNELSRLLNTDNFYISLYDRENDLITFPYYVDEDSPERDPASASPRKRRKGLTEYVMKSGKAVILNQKKIKGLLKKGKIKEIGKSTQIWLGAPLKSNKKVFGVIAVQSYKDSEAYTKEDLELFKFISSQISIAIEQTQSTLALKNSEANYHALADRSIQGIIIVQDFKIVYANRVFARISGYSIKELLSLPPKKITNLIHPDDQKLVWGNWQKRLSGENVPPRYEYRGVRKDEKLIWLEMFASRVTHNGRPAVQGSIIDITEGKMNSLRLKHLNTVLHAIRKTNQIIVREKDESHLLKTICKTLIETRGYFSAWAVILDDNGKFKNAYESGFGIGFKPMLRWLKKGKLPHCCNKSFSQPGVLIVKRPSSDCRGCPLSTSYENRATFSMRLKYAGKLYGVLGVSIPRALANSKKEQLLFKEVAGDIVFALHNIELEKATKEARKAIEQSESFRKSIIESSYDCIKVLDLDGNLLFMSKGGQKLMDIDNIEKYLGKSWVKFWKGMDRKAAQEAIKKAKSGKIGTFLGFCSTAKGIPKWWHVVVSPVKNSKGKIKQLLSISRDITVHKQLDQNLEKQRNQLALLNSINVSVNEGKTLSEIFKILSIKTSQIYKSSGATVYLTSEDGKYITMQYLNLIPSLRKTIEKIIGVKIPKVKIPLMEKGIYSQVIKDRKTLLLNDERSIKKLMAECTNNKLIKKLVPQIYRVLNLKSVIIIPLISENKTIGLMDIGRKEPFTKSDIKRFTAIADNLSLAIAKRMDEETIEKSEEEKSTILNNMSEIVVRYDREMHILWANGMTAQIYGVPIQQVLGKKCYEVWHKRNKPCENCPIVKTKSTLSLQTDEIATPDGRMWLVKSYPIFKKAGKLDSIVEVATNITKLKIAENSLKQSEEKYRTLVENTPDGIFVASKTAKFLSVNKAICERLGYSESEITSMNVEDIMTEKYKKVFRKRIVRILKGDALAEPDEYKVKAKNGKEYIIEVSFVPYIRNGKTIGFQGVARDITKRKELEEKLVRIQKLESLGTLAGGIAHDFNNILTGILAGISIVKMQMDPQSKTYDVLKDTEKACARASNLTKQLLTFSKGGMPIKESFNMKELVKGSAEFAMRGSKHECKLFIPDNLWDIEADKGQVSQVIQNLVINADQATPESGVIVLKAKNIYVTDADRLPLKKGKYIKLSIEDFGIGISEEYRNKIFDPYFTTKQDGSGLGLSICHSIINKHNGYITAISEFSVGTTFTFYLPAIGKTFEEKEKNNSQIPHGKGRVLVMDDDEIVRNAVGMMLENLGYEAEFALHGAETIDKYRTAFEQNKPFDAVIMDLIIPGRMGGKEAIKELNKIDPNVKAVVSSGYSSDPIMSNYSEYGFSGVAAKPFDLSTLSKILHKLITKEKNQGNLF